MSEFDAKARDWDKNQGYIIRSEAVAQAMLRMIPVRPGMKALEYGSGTALLSFALKDHFSEITLMDNSREMTAVAGEKIAGSKIGHMKTLFFDLEHQDFDGEFDIIYSQMVMHHVGDIDAMFGKFYKLITPGGYLAAADLYTEDGSFHGESFHGHTGFDPEDLGRRLQTAGFDEIEYQPCFVIKKTEEDGKSREFPVFLLKARRP